MKKSLTKQEQVAEAVTSGEHAINALKKVEETLKPMAASRDVPILRTWQIRTQLYALAGAALKDAASTKLLKTIDSSVVTEEMGASATVGGTHDAFLALRYLQKTNADGPEREQAEWTLHHSLHPFYGIVNRAHPEPALLAQAIKIVKQCLDVMESSTISGRAQEELTIMQRTLQEVMDGTHNQAATVFARKMTRKKRPA